MTINFVEDEDRKRHGIIGLAIGFGGLSVLLLLGAVLFWLPIWDIEPVDDADMFTEWTQIPEEENAVQLFEDWPEYQRVPQSSILEWREEPEVYADQISKFLDETGPFMDRLHAILALGAVQPPQVESYGSVLTITPGAMDVNEILHQRFILTEDLEERMALIRLHHQFGLVIGEHSESLIHALITLAIENNFMGAARCFVRDERVTPEHLSEIGGLLANLPDMRRVFADAYRSEYRVFNQAIEEKFAFMDEQDSLNWERHLSMADFMFHPNRSRKVYLEQMRRFILILDEPVYSEEAMISEVIGDMYIRGREIRPNMIGELFLSITLPSLEGPIRRVFMRDAEVRVLQIMVALHQYRQETGDWPMQLEDLVPDFLSTVPPDPFDGEPLRYQRETQVVYSVGPNRTDDGGSRESVHGTGETERLTDMKGLVFRFDTKISPGKTR
jgi:hypothetical protein